MCCRPFASDGRLALLAILAVSVAVPACDKNTPPPKARAVADAAVAPGAVDAAETRPADTDAAAALPPGTPDAAAPPATTGSVSGKVRFEGAPPAMPALDRSRDPNCPQDALAAGFVKLGAGGGVRDAVVRLPVGAAPARKPARRATIDQKGCVYTPAVLAIVAGEKVAFRNSDPTSHNVRAMHDDEILFNEMHIIEAPDKVMAMAAQPGAVVQMKCDVHPWMEAWIVVTDHGLAAVTAGDGGFAIDGVPPGKQTVEVWHPYLGTKSVEVVIEAGKTAVITFPAFAPGDYRPPAQ